MIRPYTPADRAACLGLFRGNVPRWFDAAEEADFTAFLDRLPGPYLVMTDDEDGALVACGGWARGRELASAVLTWGLVRADRHGLGLGGRMLRARLEGIDSIGGFRTVEASTSQHSEGFFARYGFVRRSVEPDGFAPGLDRVYMVLTLGRPPTPRGPARTVVLETERLRLREATLEDAEFLLALLNEPAWIEHIGDRNVHTLEAARTYLAERFITIYRRKGFGFWIVERKEDGVVMGVSGLAQRDFLEDVDVGYALLSPYWGRGYALEATRAVLAWARQRLGCERILAIVSPGNARSIQLLEKLGLRYQRTIAHPPGDEQVAVYG